MAGYSGTPLPQKLGIRPGARLRFVAAPEGFAGALGALPAGVRFASRGPADVVVFFTDDAPNSGGDSPGSREVSTAPAGCGWPGPRRPRACRPTSTKTPSGKS